LQIRFVGALNDGKGAGRALDVSRRLVELGVDHRLHFLGDGPDRLRYEARAAEDRLPVVFHGWLPRSSLAAHYAAAHIVLLPSESEGWPKVLSEAMAYGAVPVASAVSSIPQVLEETGAGFACPRTDIDAFARAIESLRDAPERWAAMAAAGVAAADRFTYHTYQDAVRDLFLRRFGLWLNASQPEAAHA
jgi:glycosyltransferase involved in cell wall biosynthesis